MKKSKRKGQDISQAETFKTEVSNYDEELWLLRHASTNVSGVLRIAFRWYQLDNYLSNLWEWLQAAIGNGKSVYEKGKRRTGLMKFYQSVVPLLEALNAINETNKIKEQISDKTKISLAETNLSTPPQKAIQEFCHLFTWEYCRMELWDWLDAGISNNDFYQVGLDRSFLLLEYQCVYSLIESAYIMYTQFEVQELQFEEKEIVESKSTNDVLLNIKYFFLNNPLEQAKASMQEFYSAWVHHTAQVAAPNEHSEMLMFHDYVVELFDELHNAVDDPVNNEKAQPNI